MYSRGIAANCVPLETLVCEWERAFAILDSVAHGESSGLFVHTLQEMHREHAFLKRHM